MAETRQRYGIEVRHRAGEMYIHQEMDIDAISDALNVPGATLMKWRWEDNWIEDKKEAYTNRTNGDFTQTLDYLVKTIRRLAQRLYESTLPPIGSDDEDDEGFVLPNENLELRIQRLTRSFERIFPMGTFMRTKQKVDVIRELQKFSFDQVTKHSVTHEEMTAVSRVIGMYLESLDTRQKRVGED
jgi:hypothetical protein